MESNSNFPIQRSLYACHFSLYYQIWKCETKIIAILLYCILPVISLYFGSYEKCCTHYTVMHNSLKALSNVVTWKSLGFYWCVHTLPQAFGSHAYMWLSEQKSIYTVVCTCQYFKKYHFENSIKKSQPCLGIGLVHWE